MATLNLSEAIQTEALDRVNVALQGLIETAEQDLDRDLALAIAQIKFVINQTFDRKRKEAMG